MLGDLQSALGVFAIFMVMFLPLERLFAMHRQPVLRAEWWTDLAFFFGQYVLWTAPVVASLVWLRETLHGLPLGAVHDTLAAQPYWLQAILAVAVSDLCTYWGHRLAHRVPVLWRFHKVHHTAVELDWLAAYREHPVDNLYTRATENVPLILLGFPLETIAGFVVFRGIWGLFIHANLVLRLGPLKYVLGSSRLHHWHHSLENDHCNFANLMPLMDLAFGTYFDPGRDPEAYGIPEAVDHGYVQQLVQPMTPRGLTARPSLVTEDQAHP